MLTKEEIAETKQMLQVKPMHHSILVLVPTVSDTTDSGIIKGDTLTEEDAAAKQQFLEVIAVAEDVETIVVGDKVFIQGTITTFSPDILPPELDVAPEGYTVGSALDMYVRMKI
jgi:co-chaperonin GroES (HSP10)